MDCFLVYLLIPFVFLFSCWLPLSYSRIIPLCEFPALFSTLIVTTDVILPTALQTVLAILHFVCHNYFGSHHLLLVLYASVFIGFLLFFLSTSNLSLSHAFHSRRTGCPWSQAPIIPWDAIGTGRQTGCRSWRNEGARSWGQSMMYLNTAEIPLYEYPAQSVQFIPSVVLLFFYWIFQKTWLWSLLSQKARFQLWERIMS